MSFRFAVNVIFESVQSYYEITIALKFPISTINKFSSANIEYFTLDGTWLGK